MGGQNFEYAGSNNINDVAWYEKNSNNTHAIKGKKPNAYGLYDMSGNVWEWTATLDVNGRRVLEGGGWSFPSVYCRVVHGSNSAPEDRDFNTGFRVIFPSSNNR